VGAANEILKLTPANTKALSAELWAIGGKPDGGLG
jgi:hypothetical protein